jgi:hypothetical protein
MVDKERLRNLVLDVLRERFEGVEVDSITIEPDVDADGDDILLVNVIFDGKHRKLDPRRAASLLRHIRPKFEEIGEKAFPVISFIAKADMRKAKSEAA